MNQGENRREQKRTEDKRTFSYISQTFLILCLPLLQFDVMFVRQCSLQQDSVSSLHIYPYIKAFVTIIHN